MCSSQQLEKCSEKGHSGLSLSLDSPQKQRLRQALCKGTLFWAVILMSQKGRLGRVQEGRGEADQVKLLTTVGTWDLISLIPSKGTMKNASQELLTPEIWQRNIYPPVSNPIYQGLPSNLQVRIGSRMPKWVSPSIPFSVGKRSSGAESTIDTVRLKYGIIKLHLMQLVMPAMAGT